MVRYTSLTHPTNFNPTLAGWFDLQLPKNMIHRDQVEKYDGSLAELAEDIGNLRYDALATFLDLLSAKIEQDSHKDQERGRAKLASSLHDCSEQVNLAARAIDRAWKICQPYMKDNPN